MWSEQQEGSSQVVSGNANYNKQLGGGMLSYDVAHAIPWDWKVSLYTWTKGIASGVYLVAALMVCLDFLAQTVRCGYGLRPLSPASFSPLLAVSLIWDLEHPNAFISSRDRQ